MCDLPPTDMLYMTYEGNQLMECTAKVLQVSQKTDETPASVVLDRSVLHAQGGGQPTDLGVIVSADNESASFTIQKVMTDRATGVTQHTGSFATEEDTFREGDPVQVKVDAETRRILSECHTGMFS